jgi:hypothetical protein
MEQSAQADTNISTPHPASIIQQNAPPLSVALPAVRRHSSVLEYLIEPDIPEHDYAAQPPPDEELPSYEGHSLPSYEERHLQAPVVSYCFYQVTRTIQIITPTAMNNAGRPRYRLAGRGSPRLFSKKADFTLTRLPTGRQAALGNCPERDVATVNFDRNGELPWMPRATVCHGDCVSSKKSLPMRARNFVDWNIEIGPETFTWRLADRPTSLVLVENSSDSIVARFSYSRFGTDATRGGEVGQLDIYGGSQSEDQDRIELVMSSCKVAVEHFKSMGRHYRNNVTSRRSSVNTELGSSLLSNMSGIPRRASHAV